MIGENEYADLVRGMTFEPSIPDLTHYMEAVSRLRKENADLRTQLAAAEGVLWYQHCAIECASSATSCGSCGQCSAVKEAKQKFESYRNTYGKGE